MSGGFQCQEVWKAPSVNNTLAQCFINGPHLQSYFLSTPQRIVPCVFGALAILMSVLVLLFYPATILGRYCCGCCGSYRRRPNAGCCCKGEEWDDKEEDEKNDAYSRKSVIGVKAAAFVIFVCSVAATLVTLSGSSKLSLTYGQLFADAVGIIDWGNQKIDTVRNDVMVKDATGVKVLIPPLTDALFTDMHKVTAGFKGQILSFKAALQQYVDSGNIVGLCVSICPLAFLAVTVACAVFDVRKVVLLINSVFHYILILPCGVVGGLLLISSVLFVDASWERTNFLTNGPTAPGILSYWFIPTMEAEVPFKRIRDEVSNAEFLNSKDGCFALRTICSPTAQVYDASAPKVVYKCPGLINEDGSDCSTAVVLSNFINATTMLPGSPVTCINTSSAADCNINRCSDACDDATVKAAATRAKIDADFGAAAKAAYLTSVSQLLNFTLITTEFLNRISVLDSLGNAFIQMGCGLWLFCFFFVAGLIVIFLGQKRFFKLSRQLRVMTDGEPAAA